MPLPFAQRRGGPNMGVSRIWKPVSGAVGLEYKVEVEVKIKQLVDCPLQNRNLFVKLKWGRGVWGVREDFSTTQPCTNRIVEWNDTFKHQCAVYIEGPALPEDPQKRELLLKKQPSSAYLRMSLRKDSEKSFAGKNKRYAFVDVNLVEWALAYGDGMMHTDRRLLHGTNANSYLTLEITVRWLGKGAMDSPIGITAGNASFDGSGKAPFVFQKIPSLLPPMEDCAEAPMGGTATAQSLQHMPSYWSEKQQDDEELNDKQLQFLQAGASRVVVGFGAGEDRVSAAIAATRMSQEECLSLIDQVFKKTMGDKDTAVQSASAALLALRI